MKTLIMIICCSLTITSIGIAQPCNPSLRFNSEIVNAPSTAPCSQTCGYNQPISLKTSGKFIHLYFPTSPCDYQNGGSVTGNYKAMVNGNPYFSGGGTVNQHINFPTSSLVQGLNTITIKAVCGTASCDLTQTFKVYLWDPSTMSANINLTGICCQTVPGPQNGNRTENTGEVKFRMSGTASPGVMLKVESSTGVTIVPFVADNGSGNGLTPCFFTKKPKGRPFEGVLKITLVDPFGNTIPSALLQSQSFDASKGCHFITYDSWIGCEKMYQKIPEKKVVQ